MKTCLSHPQASCLFRSLSSLPSSPLKTKAFITSSSTSRMTTSPQNRLNQLFRGITLPAKNPPDQVHFSDQEFIDQATKNNPPKLPPPASPQPPLARNDTPVQPATHTDIDYNSDDDDYTNAFVVKPSMRAQELYDQPKPRYLSELHNEKNGNHSTRIHATSPTDHLQHDDNDTASSSQGGQAPRLLGKFCQFVLAAKFPYKYMDDGNDQVSRQFFADNKFYSRPWDL